MSSLSGISKEQRELLKLIKKGKQNLNFVGELNSYKTQYASKVKMVNGKPVVWDERTNKPFDQDVARTFVNKKFYGTDTPFKDLAYLKERDRLKLQKIDPLRKRFSRKTVDGSTVYEEEFAAKQAKNKENLFNLSLGTSYDHALNPGSPGYKDGGEEQNPDQQYLNELSKQNNTVGDYSTGTGVPIKDDNVVVNNNATATVTLKNNESIDNSIVTDTPKEKNSKDLKIKGSLERWTRGSGRTLKQANEQSLAWLQEQGFDTSKLNKYNSAEALQRLRISGPHYTKADQSMIRVGDTVLRKNLKIKKPEAITTGEVG